MHWCVLVSVVVCVGKCVVVGVVACVHVNVGMRHPMCCYDLV